MKTIEVCTTDVQEVFDRMKDTVRWQEIDHEDNLYSLGLVLDTNSPSNSGAFTDVRVVRQFLPGIHVVTAQVLDDDHNPSVEFDSEMRQSHLWPERLIAKDRQTGLEYRPRYGVLFPYKDPFQDLLVGAASTQTSAEQQRPEPVIVLPGLAKGIGRTAALFGFGRS